jgi:hypothetical protein
VGTPEAVMHCATNEEGFLMHPAFWPMQAFALWLDVVMLPWKMTMAPIADSLAETAAASDPAPAVGLDPVSPQEIGTSATDFRI